MNCKSIKEEGTHLVKLTDVSVIKHRFRPEDPAGMEIRFTGQNQNGEEARAYVSLSSEYIQSGNNQGKSELEVGIQKLALLGIPNGGTELKKLHTLVGQKVEFYAKENSKGYINYFINTNKPEEVVDASAAQSLLMSLYGNAPAQNQQDKEMFTGSNPAPVNNAPNPW